ncbi:MAG TPA: response regulator [Planctomycetaceae bacterium]|nr:response regulator [Planctomycetaceae bacterium]
MNILVVDDDAMVLQVCRGMLSQLEHSCVCVSSAVQAIDLLTESTESFDLIIIDNLLPQLSGMELFAILREWKISIPVILVSGMMPSFEICEQGEQPPKFHFLGKPFTIAQLESAIRKSIA